MAEFRLPYYAEERGSGLVLLSGERRKDRLALGRSAVGGVRTGAEPKIDETPSFRRRQRMMRDFV